MFSVVHVCETMNLTVVVLDLHQVDKRGVVNSLWSKYHLLVGCDSVLGPSQLTQNS